MFSGEWGPLNSFEHKQIMRGCKNEAQADSGDAVAAQATAGLQQLWGQASCAALKHLRY